ncbi:DUF736 domain-containing protein [Rhizobium sp. P40RR-XXII]|nr:DUF736 domain-containing protein [Rhizobium sp. P28RR-XV]NLS20217.1 DUF736 domain-containing protein [Rhizobium sp. P40RR-XXII]
MSDRRPASPRSSSRNGLPKLSSPERGTPIPRGTTKFLLAALHLVPALQVRPDRPRSFTTSETGFNGSIRTLALNVRARIARIETPSDKGPHFRIYADNVDYAENVIMQSVGR